MSEYVIEDDIPVPIPGEGRCSRWHFVKQMKAGQSFVLLKKDHGAVRAYAHRERLKITCRSISDSELRVWKLEVNDE